MMQNSDHIAEELPFYLEGSVSETRRKIIEDHLRTCEQCTSSLREWKQMKAAIGIIEHVEPPPWLTSKIMNRVREQRSFRRSLLQTLFYPFHIKLPAQAVATCVIAITVLFLHSHFGPETFTGSDTDKSVTTANRNAAEAPATTGADAKESTISSIPRKQQAGNNKPAVQTKEDDYSVLQKESGYVYKERDEQTAEQQNIQRPSVENPKKENAPAAAAPKLKSMPESSRSTASDNQAPPSFKADTLIFTGIDKSFPRAAEQVRGLLIRLDAKNVQLSVNDPNTIFVTAEIPSENLQAFAEALEHFVAVQSRNSTSDKSREYTPVRIEISKSNRNR